MSRPIPISKPTTPRAAITANRVAQSMPVPPSPQFGSYKPPPEFLSSLPPLQLPASRPGAASHTAMARSMPAETGVSLLHSMKIDTKAHMLEIEEGLPFFGARRKPMQPFQVDPVVSSMQAMPTSGMSQSLMSALSALQLGPGESPSSSSERDPTHSTILNVAAKTAAKKLPPTSPGVAAADGGGDEDVVIDDFMDDELQFELS